MNDDAVSDSLRSLLERRRNDLDVSAILGGFGERVVLFGESAATCRFAGHDIARLAPGLRAAGARTLVLPRMPDVAEVAGEVMEETHWDDFARGGEGLAAAIRSLAEQEGLDLDALGVHLPPPDRSIGQWSDAPPAYEAATTAFRNAGLEVIELADAFDQDDRDRFWAEQISDVHRRQGGSTVALLPVGTVFTSSHNSDGPPTVMDHLRRVGSNTCAVAFVGAGEIDEPISQAARAAKLGSKRFVLDVTAAQAGDDPFDRMRADFLIHLPQLGLENELARNTELQ